MHGSTKLKIDTNISHGQTALSIDTCQPSLRYQLTEILVKYRASIPLRLLPWGLKRKIPPNYQQFIINWTASQHKTVLCIVTFVRTTSNHTHHTLTHCVICLYKLLKAKEWICGTYERESSPTHKEHTNAVCSLIFMLNSSGKTKVLSPAASWETLPLSAAPIFHSIHVTRRSTTEARRNVMPYTESSVNIWRFLRFLWQKTLQAHVNNSRAWKYKTRVL